MFTTQSLAPTIKQFQPHHVFDETVVGLLYAENNSVEWYDIVARLNSKEITNMCHFFHMEVILGCEAHSMRYSKRLAERYAQLN